MFTLFSGINHFCSFRIELELLAGYLSNANKINLFLMISPRLHCKLVPSNTENTKIVYFHFSHGSCILTRNVTLTGNLALISSEGHELFPAKSIKMWDIDLMSLIRYRLYMWGEWFEVTLVRFKKQHSILFLLKEFNCRSSSLIFAKYWIIKARQNALVR